MHMICDTADTVAFAISVAGDGGEVGVERGTNGCIEDECAVFGTEDEVDEEE